MLLTLLCLEFQHTKTFPTSRVQLYQNALKLLLKRWDEERRIERDQAYKKLSLKHKEQLLSQIALATFEGNDYSFKQEVIEGYIFNYFSNLPSASNDLEELDGEAVLRSIESQHGLLIRQAAGNYSFSHLTFQEYFAAKRIVDTRNQGSLQKLLEYIYDLRWQEIFQISINMIEDQDVFILLLKEKVDLLISNDDKLQSFLFWLQRKSKSTQAFYKLVAVRAFYLAFSLARIITRSLPGFTPNLDTNLAYDLNLFVASCVAPSLPRTLSHELDLDLNLNLASYMALPTHLFLPLTSTSFILSALPLNCSSNYKSLRTIILILNSGGRQMVEHG
ncbi:MAG: hypothetical protein HC895_09855 [Leptolyngbyaceae cyanobacterium SM1_3_5]|nr:hypothetical protein [Leptolyngbyaceae cyanobacterium SM1_3_5]